jgi:hypothetical protein
MNELNEWIDETTSEPTDAEIDRMYQDWVAKQNEIHFGSF